MTIVKQNSPHIRRKSSVSRMMADVLIALLPVVVYSIIVFRWDAVIILSISLGVMIASEFVFFGIKNKMPYDGTKHKFKEKFTYAYKKYGTSNVLAPAVSAVIYSMILPASTAYHPYVVVVGALAGIVLGKLLFGGLGSNIFNPAAVGMVVAKLSFGSSFFYNGFPYYSTELGGTILTSAKANGISIIDSALVNVGDLFLGKCPGTLGEISSLLILVGALFLFIRRSADFRPFIAYVGTFLFLMLLAGSCCSMKLGYDANQYWKFIGVEMFSGGLLFGAAFMITDPVTSPINRPGRYIYGIIAGILTAFIRLFAALPEGVVFSILIANMMSPVIDYYKWSGNKFTVKKLIWIFALPLVAGAILMIVCMSPGVLK